MKIALSQLNPTIGDLSGNCALVLEAAQQVASQADLMVCSELMISGYPPKDLLLREGFVAACDQHVADLAGQLPRNLAVLVGHPTMRDTPHGREANGCSLLFQGEVLAIRHKLLLPNYDVFDERRYFRPAGSVQPIEWNGYRLGVHICEDAWWGEPETTYHNEPHQYPDPVRMLGLAGIDILINLSASPFEVHKPSRREHIMARHARRCGKPFLFVNQVGGNDDLVFDGNSFVLNSHGDVVLRQSGFQSDVTLVDTTTLETQAPQGPRAETSIANLLDALVLGLRDYVRKSGFTDVVLGLSGGIDSAIACYIAQQAVGHQNVHALLMPSRYSSQHSVDDALKLAQTLHIDHAIIPIDAVHRAYETIETAGADIREHPASLADQNLQARIRGAIVMIRSNAHNWLPLATGNKSELAMGYCTLYGDMAGGFAVLADVLKRDVYALAEYVNQVKERCEIIPWNTIRKAPSAELAPNQFDQDSLPPYDILDAILEGLVERDESVSTLCQKFAPETVLWVAKRLDRNEYKRRQMPPGIKLSPRAFGSGRRMPMAARFLYETR